jgi:hypothetical protein
MTKPYRAEFFTAADYAVHNFEAETPQQALQMAREFFEDNLVELDFRSYDNAGLDQIQIRDDQRGALAAWESDDYRLRRAAPELLEALKDAKATIGALANDVDAFREKFGDTPYYDHSEATADMTATLDKIDAAISKASTGGNHVA